MIDFDEIRKQVAIKHNVLLDTNDPILVTVTINEMVLSRYLDLANKRYSDANRELTVALMQQQEQAKEVASRIITAATNYVSKQVQAAVSEAVETALNEAGVQLRQQITDAQIAGREAISNSQSAQSAKNGAMLAAVLASVSAIVSLATLVIFLIK